MCEEKIKLQMQEYWGGRAADFSALRLRELNDPICGKWYDVIKEYLPDRPDLKILDIGTGTGFFAFMLARHGYDVTGIDLTREMIEQARLDARNLNLPVHFLEMDAENPDFPEESFDVIIARNVTWTLPNLQRAYSNWYRLLKPGGTMINFDADYCREEERRDLKADRNHKTITGLQWHMYEQMKQELRPLSARRPAWDEALLEKAGFCRIKADPDIWKHLYKEGDEFYNPTPVFLLTAKKPDSEIAI